MTDSADEVLKMLNALCDHLGVEIEWELEPQPKPNGLPGEAILAPK